MEEEWETEVAFRLSLETRCEPLRQLGWTSEGPRGPADLHLPLTAPVQIEEVESPLLGLFLIVTKWSAQVDLNVTISTHHELVRSYIQSRYARLTEIARPGQWRLSYPVPVLWEENPVLWEQQTGWGGGIDWPNWIAELERRTTQWLELLADLGPTLVEHHARR